MSAPSVRMQWVDVVTWLTVYIVLLYAIPSRLVVGPLGSAGAPSMVFALGSLTWWVWNRLAAPPVPSASGRPVRSSMFVFLLSVGVSYLAAMVRPIASDEVSPADVALLSAAAWAGTLLLTHDGISDRARFDVLVPRLAWAGALVALVGLAQFVTRQPLTDVITIPGLTATNEGNYFIREGFTRPAGTATHPIEFGVLMTMLLPLALHNGFHGRSAQVFVRWAPALMIMVAIPLSLSRSAVVGMAIVLVVLSVGWSWRRRLTIWFGGLLVGGAMALAVPGVMSSIRGMFLGIPGDPSVASRTDSYTLAWEFIATAPWFGRGLGTFLPKYRILDNQLLLLLITIGVVGLVALLLVIGSAIWVLGRLRNSAEDTSTKDLALSLMASIAAGTASLALFDAFAFPMTAGTIFLLLGMAGALARVSASHTAVTGSTVSAPDAAAHR